MNRYALLRIQRERRSVWKRYRNPITAVFSSTLTDLPAQTQPAVRQFSAQAAHGISLICSPAHTHCSKLFFLRRIGPVRRSLLVTATGITTRPALSRVLSNSRLIQAMI